MTKQERIEEMARIIAFDLCPERHIHANYGEEAKCYSDNNFAECTKIKNVVDKLYNAGYRKADEVRKETAGEILTELLDFVNGWFEGVENNDFGVEFNRISKDFSKKYGVYLWE